MSKSKFFIILSLVFLLSNFIYLLFFDTQEVSITEGFTTFSAQVVDLDKKLNGWSLVVESIELEGKVLVSTSLYPEYSYGDILEVSCKLKKPEPIVGEDGKTFAYDKYLAKDEIYSTCFRPNIKVVGQVKDLGFYLYKSLLFLCS